MGNYIVRYKGAKVKGMSKANMMMMDDSEDLMDEGADEGQEPKDKGKAPPFQPEKQIVANVLGKGKPKKKGSGK